MTKKLKSDINRAAHELSQIAYLQFKAELTKRVENAHLENVQFDFDEAKELILSSHSLGYDSVL